MTSQLFEYPLKLRVLTGSSSYELFLRALPKAHVATFFFLIFFFYFLIGFLFCLDVGFLDCWLVSMDAWKARLQASFNFLMEDDNEEDAFNTSLVLGLGFRMEDG